MSSKVSKPPRPAQTVQKVSLAQSQTSLFIGPLPAPDVLERYEQASPGLAERILLMAEREQQERLANNKAIIEAQHRAARAANHNIVRGQVFALSSVLLVCCLCGYFAWLGNVEAASSAAKWIIVSLAGVFISGNVVFRRSGPKE